MNHLLIIFISLVYLSIIISEGRDPGPAWDKSKDYCTLDQVKYGGTAKCTPGPDIDWTPAPKEKDFGYYAGIVGSVATVFAPFPGKFAAAYTNLFNNIALKYGMPSAEDNKLKELINSIDNKIRNEISRVKECLTSFVFMQDNDNRQAEITDFMKDIQGFTSITDKITTETKWDNIISDTNEGILDFGQTWFSDYDDDDMDQIPLYYELRLTIFEYFNNLYGTWMKTYFITKQRLCNDPDRINLNSAELCRKEYNRNLDLARELIEDMNIWLMKALLIIRKEIYSYDILSKDFNSSPVTVKHHPFHFVVRDNYDIERIYFGQDKYGEAVVHDLDNDSDNIDVYIRMNDNKWCSIGELWCTTWTKTVPVNMGTHYYEYTTGDCNNKLKNKGTNKRESLRMEIVTYWNKLIYKYFYPMKQRIESFYTIPYLNQNTGNEEFSPRDLEDEEKAHSLFSKYIKISEIKWKSDTSKCLSINSDNRNAYLSECDKIKDDKFIFILSSMESDGYYSLILESNNECLDARWPHGKLADGNNIGTWDCNGGDNQKWKIDGDLIRNKAYGGKYCLDVGGNNNNAHVWTCSTSINNQLFELPGFE